MSTEQVSDTRTPRRGAQIKVRLDRLKKSRQRKTLGVAEIAGLAGSAFLLLLALVSYFYFLTPSYRELESLQRERSRLQTQLRSAQEGYQHNADTKTTVATINASLESFENSRLAASGTGRMTLYTELNQLIKRNGLRNTAGPTYSMLAPLTPKAKQSTGSSERQGTARWQSVYPGIGVTVTVEGGYQNLRHFLRDIETSRQFLIINAVELESGNETNVALEGDRSGPAAQRAAPISLRLEMATYFQRGATDSTTSSDGRAN